MVSNQVNNSKHQNLLSIVANAARPVNIDLDHLCFGEVWPSGFLYSRVVIADRKKNYNNTVLYLFIYLLLVILFLFLLIALYR